MSPYMKIQTPCCLLAGLLVLCFSNAGLSEGTNESLDLFGITVTQKASEAETQFSLGSSYYTGDGVEQDLEKAIVCFKKAGEMGHARAQFNLGTCYMNGTGVEQNDREAARWFRKAADQDVKEACFPLGLCYYNLEQYTEAYAWALFAEANGDPRLKDMLDPMFSEEEIAAGKARLTELKKPLEIKNDNSE